MRGLERFKLVFTEDWHGVMVEFKIIQVIERGKGIYSCTFVNSHGDMEKKVVSDQELYQ